jgi:APA family basic amino acid/polyamine antiporter
MGLIRATSLVVGIIVGASIFVQPSEVSRHVSSIPAMFAVWLGAGVMSLAGALVCAELAAAFPKTGGIYVYLKETMSPQVAFLWGWAMFWSAHSGIIAAVSVVFARYVGYFAPLGDRGTRAVAISAILTLSAINYIGVRAGSTVQTVFTAAKLLAIGAILVAVVVMVPGHHPAALSSAATQPSIREFLLGISAGLFTFGGWHMVTYAAGETRDPEKTIPRALLIGMLIVTVCYLALNAAYLRVLPLETVLKSTRVAADAARVVVGQSGGAIVSALVIVSAFGGLSGSVLAGPRVYYAAARDGLAFRAMGAEHPLFHTPHIAILAQALWASVLVVTGTYRTLFTRVIYTEFLFFGLAALGLLRMRRRLRPAPLLFLPACALVVINQIYADPKESSIGLLLVAAGLPVYYFLKKPNKIANY